MSAVIARNPESLEPRCDSTLSRSQGEDSEPLGLSTPNDALPSGSDNTDSGLRKSAYDAGLRRGLAGYINSPVMEQISLELTVTKVVLQAVSAAAEQRERLLSHWKAEAQWWHEEHDRVHDEYCAFVKEISRRFPKCG